MAGYNRLETLQVRGTSRVSRGWRDDGTAVILKCLSGDASPKARDRLRQEYELLSKTDLPGVVKAIGLEQQDGDLILTLEDMGGESLERLLGPNAKLALEPFLNLAVGLAETLAQMHRQRIIHGSICPAHIVTNPESGEFRLIGIGSADALPYEPVASQMPAAVEANLAYIAPEQTGRMNRTVDYRTDFYSLGATFYRLLTGRPPFEAEDALGLVHRHIAAKPVPPHEVDDAIPAALSAIVMKLLAKMAEDRYQSALGLKADLERCRREVAADILPDFAPGQEDRSDRLRMPERLYGREREIETLLAAFKRIATRGKPEVVLVSGYAGVGKSSIVNALHKALVSSRGLFVAGKFDQSRRNIPYAPLVQAFEKLIRLLLGKSERELAAWREALRQALGSNASLVAELIPDLKLILGEQPPVPEVDAKLAKARFQLTFRRFVSVFTRGEHPLVLFLDDLQWGDAATLDLVEDILSEQDTGHLLLIGAYRDNEVGPDHPLTARLKSIAATGTVPQEIKLAPLNLANLTQMVADALGCAIDRAGPLAQLVHEKTEGNPFFVIEFLSALADEGLIAFEGNTGQWSWDMSLIRATKYTDNVADLLARKLTRLSPQSLITVQTFAALGNVAETPMLAVVLQVSKEAVADFLCEAIQQNLVQRSDDSYRFTHDRVHEAAYALIPETARAEIHLRLGRLLLANSPGDPRDGPVFEIVDQMNRGESLIDSRAERQAVARLNLVAGERAKASAAYLSALKYFVAGSAKLAEDCWQHEHELAFSLERHRAECEYLTGDLAAAEARLIALWQRAMDIPEFAAVTRLRMPLFMTLDRSDQAVAVGLEYLQRIGIHWSPHPTDEEVGEEFDALWKRIGDRRIETLIDEPAMTDPTGCATLDVLAELLPAAVFTDGNLHCLIVARIANLSLEQGNGGGSCFAYVWLGMLVGPLFGDYEAGYRFGELGVDLTEKRGLLGFKARVYLGFAHVVPWTRDIRKAVPLVRTAIETAQQTGDLGFANISRGALITHLLASGEPLGSVQREAENALKCAKEAHFGLVADVITAQLGLIRTLRGETPEFGCFSDDTFDECQFEAHIDANPRLAYAAWRYWIRKLQSCCYAGNLSAAIESAMRAQRLQSQSYVAYFEIAEYHFHAALAVASHLETVAADQRQEYLQRLSAHRQQLAVWAQHGPKNFASRAALVDAETARVEGRDLDAMRLYDKSIASARKNAFVQNEAVANETAAVFYRQRGFDRIGRTYLAEAVACYARWGAWGKVRQLEKLHPWLPKTKPPEAETLAKQLDAETIVKAQQALSRELRMDSLAQTLLRIVMENAGAQTGILVVEGDGALRAAIKSADGGAEEIVFDASLPHREFVPETIYNYVRRTREIVNLADASESAGSFVEDDSLRRAGARSVLCMPIQRQSNLLAVLYLENDLTANVFTAERIEFLKALAFQAAISMENAALYEAARRSEREFRAILDQTFQFIGVLSPDGSLLHANRTALEFAGVDEATVLGKFFWETPWWRHSAEAQEILKTAIQDAAKGQFVRFETSHPAANGGIHYVDFSLKPVFDEAGRVVQLIPEGRDITERKLAEAEVVRLNRELEERVAERTAELEAANKELEAFSYSVSHDLRAPLRAIEGFAHILTEDHAAQLDANGMRLLDVIRRNVSRMGDLIDDILDFSRMSRREMAMQPLDMAAMVREVFEEVRNAAEPQRHITLRMENLPSGRGDRALIRQVLFNLLSNSVKFTAARADALIEVSGSSEGAENIYRIKDNGAGFDMRYADKLFGVFQRLHSASDFEGTGIGLAIVKRIITRHGGRVWAESSIGEGATFYFALPEPATDKP